MSKAPRLITKREAQETLSQHIRNPNIEPETFLKVLSLYSRISGWDNEPPTPSLQQSENELNKLVAKVEKLRKEGSNA